MGRCIEGGVFQENCSLSDASGYRKDVFEAVKNLQVSILRWPGGNFSSGYHWEDGIGPRDKRPARPELAWGTTESNRFGTHEFLDYCELFGTQPYICVNLGTDTWDEAKLWVEYCNLAGGPVTPIGASRMRREAQQMEGEQPVIHTRGLPEPQIPRRVDVPDYAHRLPEPIRQFTGMTQDAQHLSFIQRGGHGGSHPHLVHHFLSACLGEEPAFPDAETSVNWTMVGFVHINQL